MTTIDEYCDYRKISHIDFLKLDIEGNEYSAIKGCRKKLGEDAIDIIQIEFGGCNIESRVFFRDFYELLHVEYDYGVYRVLKDGLLKVENYCEQLECFSGFNYLFVKENRINKKVLEQLCAI